MTQTKYKISKQAIMAIQLDIINFLHKIKHFLLKPQETKSVLMCNITNTFELPTFEPNTLTQKQW